MLKTPTNQAFLKFFTLCEFTQFPRINRCRSIPILLSDNRRDQVFPGKKELELPQFTTPPFARGNMDLQLALDPGSGIPLHRQIYEEFRRLILNGEWAAGAKVPSSRELADLLDISRTTATSAYNQLLSEGYLKSIAGSGTYVSNELPDKLHFCRKQRKRKKKRNQMGDAFRSISPNSANTSRLGRLRN